MIRFPCLNCEDRTAGCHGACEKYAAANAENERLKEERWKAIQEDAYYVKAIMKNRRDSIRRKMGK